MASSIFLLLCVSLFSIVLADHDSFIQGYKDNIAFITHNATYMNFLKAEMNATTDSDPKPVNGEFPCTVIAPSETVPTSVNKLRPGDIKVIAAMGDSFTAGTGIDAKNIFQMLNIYRGLAWSIGGDETFDTLVSLPNILKHYNPDLVGYSVGKGDSLENARFNLAVSGSESNNLPDQTRKLIDRMRNDPTVDYENDWKIVTIMTGGNDMCHICDEPDQFSPDIFIEFITESLDMLMAEMPRVLVNLVETINVQIAKDLNKGLICTLIHNACPCAAFPGGEEEEKKIDMLMDEFHTRSEQLVATGRYDTKADFAVVVQPFLKDTFAPRKSDGEVDMSYFAPDCFHMTRKGQKAAATGLWNNMITRVNTKATVWTLGENMKCPTEESPFFFTNTNGRNVHRSRPKEESFVVEYAVEREVFIEVVEEVITKGMSTPTKESGWTNWSTNTQITIAGVFVMLVIIGLIMTVFWTRMTKKASKKTNKYQHMVEDIIYEKKPSNTIDMKKHFFP